MPESPKGKKSGPPPKKGPASRASQATVLKSGLKVLKARGGMDASKSDFNTPSSGVSGASKGPAGGASAGGNYGGNVNPNQQYGGGGGNQPPSGPPKRKIGGPDATKDAPYKSNVAMNLIAGTIIPGGGIVSELGQRKAYKDRQKFARTEGLYRDFYRTNQFNVDPNKRTLKPNSPTGKAYLKDAGYGKKTKVGGGDGGGGGAVIRCPDGSLPPCLDMTKSTPVEGGRNKVTPYQFNFQYKKGGMVRGSGKILKEKVKKARIY